MQYSRKDGNLLLITLMVCVWGVIVSCFNYNPFEHTENAKIVIEEQSFISGDTVLIFSTESLSINFTVRELIDSVTITTSDNRKFQNESMVIKPTRSGSTLPIPNKVYFSFVKTGEKQIDFKTYKRDGTCVSSQIKCFVNNPLKQNDLTGEMGKPLLLSTVPVHDKDVSYVWNFGSGIICASDTQDIITNIRKTQIRGDGELSVTDGIYFSPSVKFRYSFYDTSKPVITIRENGCILSGDTVKTSLKNFNLILEVKDPGMVRVESVSINNNLLRPLNDTLFSMRFESLQTQVKPEVLTIIAKDNYVSNNVTTKKCILVYDPDIEIAEDYEMKILIPNTSSSVTMQKTKTVMGVFSQFGEDTIDIVVKVSDGNGGNKTVIPEKRVFTTGWTSEVNLKDGKNKITATAYSAKTQKMLAFDTCFITFDSNSVDNSKPVIFQITQEGQPPGTMMVGNDFVNIWIIAFDAISGLDSVIVRNSLQESIVCTNKSEDNPYLWTALLNLKSHGENSFSVHAVDKKGLSADTQFVIIRNNTPVITAVPDSVQRILVNRKFTSFIKAEDPDGDPVSYECSDSQSGLRVDKDGIISWTPDSSYIGKQSEFVIYASDPFGARTFYTLKLMVVPSLDGRVTFRDGAIDSIPDSLPLLETNLFYFPIDTSNCIGPFTYTISNVKTGKIYYSSELNLIAIRFNVTDTGNIDFQVVIHDRFGMGDTLRKNVYLYLNSLENRLLFLKEGVDTTLSGEIDLSDSGKTIWLKFAFSDTDMTSGVRYTLKLYGDSLLYDTTISGSNLFGLPAFSDQKPFGHDTIVAVISNSMGFIDSVGIRVFYGEKIDSIKYLYPVENDTVRDSLIQFKWTGNGDVKDLHYEVFLSSEAGLLPVASTDLTHFDQYFSKSGKFRWKIRASSLKQVVEGPVSTFFYIAPDHVHLLTNQASFSDVYYISTGSIKVPLEVDTATGKKPFTFKALFTDNRNELPVKNDTLAFTPTVSDTGIRQVLLIVTDAAGNSDTVSVNLNIRQRKPLDCQLLNEGILKDNVLIDLSGKLDTVTLLFKVSAENSDTLEVLLKNVEVFSELDTNGILKVQIDPGIAVNPIEDLTIKIRQGVNVFQRSYRILYGDAPLLSGPPVPASGTSLLTSPDTLRWTFSDKDSDSISYDVYLGTELNPAPVVRGIKTSFYKIENNLSDGTYYWYVVASDSRFSTTGPVWNFTVNKQED